MRLFILSRFNVVHRHTTERRSRRRMNDRRFNRQWLEQRLALMSRYTAPSINSQTDNRFEWYVFVQDRTPSDVVTRIKEMGAQVVVSKTDDVDAAQSVVRKYRGIIATLNLDTDDALSRDFVEEFHAHAGEHTGTFGFLRGMVLRQEIGKPPFAIGWRSEKIPFQALIERGEKAETIFFRVHGKIDRLHDTHRPMWLQVIHGDNIDNWKLKKSKKDQNIIHHLNNHFTVYPKMDYGRNTNK